MSAERGWGACWAGGGDAGENTSTRSRDRNTASVRPDVTAPSQPSCRTSHTLNGPSMSFLLRSISTLMKPGNAQADSGSPGTSPPDITGQVSCARRQPALSSLRSYLGRTTRCQLDSTTLRGFRSSVYSPEATDLTVSHPSVRSVHTERPREGGFLAQGSAGWMSVASAEMISGHQNRQTRLDGLLGRQALQPGFNRGSSCPQKAPGPFLPTDHRVRDAGGRLCLSRRSPSARAS